MMHTEHTAPDRKTMIAGLRSALAGDGTSGRCEVIQRRPFDYVSSYPIEILTCQIDGRRAQVLVKHAAVLYDLDNHKDHGARGGVAYEARIYRQVLARVEATVPRCLGFHEDRVTGQAWLALEYLEDNLRVSKLPGPHGMIAAAAWAGRFQAALSGLAASLPAWMIRYDGAFYRGWVERTLASAGEWRQRLLWLEPLCARAMELLPCLLERPTVIHGEFYPINILVRHGTIYPVDWESAAVAAGEIDLASLTEGWPDEVARECLHAYRQARWPGGAPLEFERRLMAARLHNHFRWLAAAGQRIAYPRGRALFTALGQFGRQAGLVNELST